MARMRTGRSPRLRSKILSNFMRAVGGAGLLFLPACATTVGAPALPSTGSTAPASAVTLPPAGAAPAANTPQAPSSPALPAQPPAPLPALSPPPSPAPAPPVSAPAPFAEVIETDIIPTPINPNASAIAALPYWQDSDVTPALIAFQRSCRSWQSAAQDAPLNPSLPEYGTYGDWGPTCAQAQLTPLDFGSAHDFFERQFTPVTLWGQNNESGLMTGYYQPEINVKRRADAFYNEPILAKPKSDDIRTLPRAALSAASSRVIAYGRPMDVFFMQIQGSGHLKYEDGTKIRAAYAGNNGYPYRSIGSVLIKRGEIEKDKSSKRDIEKWMAENGPAKARALMNENKRYIYFAEQKITPGEGPKGAMRVPLTAMGSMAVDPRYHPYGTLVWLELKLPQKKGDYLGRPSGQLLSAQDTGKAIRGALRGDLYFGSGKNAGDLAGVMKHRALWSIFLPRALAARLKENRPADTS